MKRTAPEYAYKVLGVSPLDDFATIRKKWRALARDHHPDVASGCPKAATKRFAEINEAYDLLRFHRDGFAALDQSEKARKARERARHNEARRRAQAEMQRQARMARQQAEERAQMKAEQEAHEAALRAAKAAEAAKARTQRDPETDIPSDALVLKPRIDASYRAAREGYAGLRAMGRLLRSTVDLST
ncbi:J domain-containing protein [Primorskyibacter sp. S187A]|uniref:J domain-containing protein n=1 Tax=Primorskyibacter sp. S187A TaxID=3415130 RepID=UPI003C7BE00B